MTKQTSKQYAVGDKVRILGLSIFDANEIGNTGVITDGNCELCIGGYGAVVKLPDGAKRVYEYENIEKVAEQMTKKFNVGDTVRIVKKYDTLSGFNVGDIAQVSAAKHDGSKSGGYAEYSVRNANSRGHCNVDHIELVNAKPTQSTPKKKARISTLEQQVAELTAKVEALEKAQKPTFTLSDNPEAYWKGDYVGGLADLAKSPNEQRKAIIAEAKAFVAKYVADDDALHRSPENGKLYDIGHHYTKFHVNKEKRVVTALIFGKYTNAQYAKAIAKCAPDDVFNADIGKAIALGRALGLDVERFEQAVKPTEVVVGMAVRGNNFGNIYEVSAFHADERLGGQYGRAIAVDGVRNSAWVGTKQVSIIDDTDAQY